MGRQRRDRRTQGDDVHSDFNSDHRNSRQAHGGRLRMSREASADSEWEMGNAVSDADNDVNIDNHSEMQGIHQFDGGVGVGGHGAGLLSDDDFEAWIITLLEEYFDMTPIDFDMGSSNILDNKNKKKIVTQKSRFKPSTRIGTSDPSMLSNVNGPSLFNILESGLSPYSTMIPIIPQGNAPQSDIIFES
ncbi:hypothetical protein QJS10_CPA05g01719 [Acorus calamus]|uniref:Uncharacterized protein n=1 Tax=Acorus calamus TaxID=4465 RepID=A0AAV9ER71_ACOCL|nr:hypothetical protein QJS10_CPA05g01719 [Acorus calamus]